MLDSRLSVAIESASPGAAAQTELHIGFDLLLEEAEREQLSQGRPNSDVWQFLLRCALLYQSPNIFTCHFQTGFTPDISPFLD